LSDIYASEAKWEADFKKVQKDLPQIAKFAGRLGESADVLLECFTVRDKIGIMLGKLYVYANMKSHEDTAVSKYQGLSNRVSTLSVEFSTAASYITPEILALPEKKLLQYIKDKKLKDYSFGLKELMRQREHVLSLEEEILLAKSGDMAGVADNAFSMLTNADMKFPPIKGEDGKTVEMSEERAVTYLRSRKRPVRKAAFQSLYKPYNEMRNTLGATFDGMLKSAKFYADARKYASPLASALDGDNIPESVYHNLVDTLEKNLKPLHDYVALRKKILGVKELHMYDIYTPLVNDPFKDISWTQAKGMMLEALSPLGAEYLSNVKEGLASGWIDVFTNQGKRSGAYSWGTYGTHPYIFMNYTNSLNDVSTLVHEMGHSMHSFYSRKNQPYATAGYSIFTAEVASTTNEVLFLKYLIGAAKKKNERVYLMNRLLENIRTTVYRQTMFASFEREVHRRAAAGEDTTPDGLQVLWRSLNETYYGPDIVVDKELEMEWARIPHFYTPFYVYQYATGYSAATALASGILKHGEPARLKYLHFLTTGGSDYPINLLKDAGVDMSTPAPVEEVIRIFSDTLEEMQSLMGIKA
jgi:oligoendopeptidase F